jgi:SAM-dependent methyltransferase
MAAHEHVHLDEADWARLADHAEREGELLLAFVTDSGRWISELRGRNAPPVRLVLDIGSGPGVGTCELARLFTGAQVVAVDGSPAMLERASRRAAAHGLDDRVSTHLAELPHGLEGLGAADVIWASMSLHHVGDEVKALRLLRDRLAPEGLIVIAEVAEPMRVLPDDLGVGPPGLADRLAAAEQTWFASMRAGLPGSVPSSDLESTLVAAGYDVAGARMAIERFDPPLSMAGREVVLERVRRLRHQLEGLLDDEDLQALDVLGNTDDPRGVAHHPDVFIAASRHIVAARARQGS